MRSEEEHCTLRRPCREPWSLNVFLSQLQMAQFTHINSVPRGEVKGELFRIGDDDNWWSNKVANSSH